MNEKKVKFYWDIGSTNSYFAFHLLRPLAAKHGARIEYVPLNLGYVFRYHGYTLMDEPKIKLINRKIDLARWAKRYDLPFRMPDQFPIKTSRVLRGALAMREKGLEEAYMSEVFVRYWERNDPTIQTYEGLAESVTKLGVDAVWFEQRSESDEIRALAVSSTEQALSDGVFGAPVMQVEDQLYWGKDRFEFVDDHLAALVSG